MFKTVIIINHSKTMRVTIIETDKKFVKEKGSLMHKLRCWSNNLIVKDHGRNRKY